MKTINNFILERLKLNDESKINNNDKVKISKATFKQISEYVDDLNAYLKDIIPHLNDKWQSYLKETYNDNDIDSVYQRKKDNMKLKDYRGYDGRFSYQYGHFHPNYSCEGRNNQDTIKKLNSKIDDDFYKDEEYKLIFSTCCDYLGCYVIGDDPLTEWTVGMFRKVHTAMHMVIYQLIN